MECAGITKAGKKCSRKPKENCNYCWQHTSDEKKLVDEGLTMIPLQNPIIPTIPQIRNNPLPKSTIANLLPKSVNNSYLAGKGIFLGEYTKKINLDLIETVLQQIHPDTKINTEALEFVNSITYNLYQKFSEAKTIAEFGQSINENIPEQLKKHASREVIKEKNNLEASGATKDQILSKIKITLIEYLVAEILEVSGNETRDNRRVVISYEDVQRAISADRELKKLIDKYIPGIIIPGEYLVILHHTKSLLILKRLKKYP